MPSFSIVGAIVSLKPTGESDSGLISPPGGPTFMMNVIHLVDRADSIAGLETCAAFDSHAREFSFAVVHGNKARIVKHLRIFIAPDVHVNVGDNADAKAFVKRIEAPVWKRARNFLRTHGTNRLAISTEDIEPAVKMMATIVESKLPRTSPIVATTSCGLSCGSTGHNNDCSSESFVSEFRTADRRESRRSHTAVWSSFRTDSCRCRQRTALLVYCCVDRSRFRLVD